MAAMVNLFLAFLSCIVLPTFASGDVSYLTPEQRAALEECERTGQTFCDLHTIPDEGAINGVLLKNPQILKNFNILSGAENIPVEAVSENVRSRRNSRATTAICQAKADVSKPFNFVKTEDGWSQLASTSLFTQKTSFRTEACQNENSPCRYVAPTIPDYDTSCYTQYVDHQLLLWDHKNSDFKTREIHLASACKCQLVSKPASMAIPSNFKPPLPVVALKSKPNS